MGLVWHLPFGGKNHIADAVHAGDILRDGKRDDRHAVEDDIVEMMDADQGKILAIDGDIFPDVDGIVPAAEPDAHHNFPRITGWPPAMIYRGYVEKTRNDGRIQARQDVRHDRVVLILQELEYG